MKIIFSTFDDELIEDFVSYGQKNQIEVLGFKTEKGILDEIINNNKVDGFVLSNHFAYTQKVVDYIRKKMPGVPIVIYSTNYTKIKNADIQMPKNIDFSKIYMDIGPDSPNEFLFNITIENINRYNLTFSRLKTISEKSLKPISFGECVYDPTRRTLSHSDGRIITFRGKEVKKMTAKQGGILELLGANQGKVVKKEIILEKVWQKTDYFSGRSMDVYITNLRNLLKENKIDLKIENITGTGLILLKLEQ